MQKSFNQPNTRQFEPVVSEKKLFNMNHVAVAFIAGFVIVLSVLLSIALLDLDFSTIMVVSLVSVIVYAVILFFLLEPELLREIQTKEVEYQTIEKPVEVVRTIEKPIIKTVEKPVEVIKTVEKQVQAPKKKLNIPKYKYIGSTESRSYHKRSCRFGKLIKRKYKVSKNNPTYFKARRYAPCKVCKPDKS